MAIELFPTDTNHSGVAPSFAALQRGLGTIPNLARVLAHSPAALQSWIAFNSNLQTGDLPAALRERIALAIAEANHCHYCLAAHTLLGAKAGLSDEEIMQARLGTAADSYTNSILRLALAINRQRGQLSDLDRQAARQAGMSDATIIEVSAHVVLNIFTNYINHVAETPVDFPQAPALPAA